MSVGLRSGEISNSESALQLPNLLENLRELSNIDLNLNKCCIIQINSCIAWEEPFTG